MNQLQTSGFQHGEREFSLTEAAHRVYSAIAELGLTAQLQDYGGSPTVWGCRLADENHALLPEGVGWGKGRTEDARIGSIYESLEHHLTQRPSTQAELRSCADVANSELASEAYAPLLAGQPDAHIACRVYSQLEGDRALAVPVFLSNAEWVEHPIKTLRTQVGDTTDYKSLARYSSNSGCAIGGSLNEAAVHAINEAIERDAFSLLLIQCLGTATPASLRFLDPNSLPEDLSILLGQVQDRIGREVWLIDITTDLGVPSTLAYSSGHDGHHLWGCGVSLASQYSVFRALTELLQEHLLGDDDVGIDRLMAIERLKDIPVLHAAAQLDLRQLAASASQVPYVATTSPSSPSGHLSELVRKLADRGFRVYLNETYRLPNGITAVHVHVPGLERFHMIVHGLAVLPGHRGMSAMRRAQQRQP